MFYVTNLLTATMLSVSLRVSSKASSIFVFHCISGPIAGSADDWAKGVVGTKFTYTFELRDRGHYGFLLPAVQIQPTFQEIFSALSAMAEAIFKSSFYIH